VNKLPVIHARVTTDSKNNADALRAALSECDLKPSEQKATFREADFTGLGIQKFEFRCLPLFS
jgi:hypothetical protein